jgi:hypothetical protein
LLLAGVAGCEPSSSAPPDAPASKPEAPEAPKGKAGAVKSIKSPPAGFGTEGAPAPAK